MVPFLDFPNRRGQNVGGGLFEQKTRRAQRHHLLDIRVITVRGENEHLRAGNGFEDLPGGFQAVEQRHRDVHHHHGGTKFSGQGHRLAAGFRFADHLDIPFGFQQGPKAFADNRVVFRQQNSDAFYGRGLFHRFSMSGVSGLIGSSAPGWFRKESAPGWWCPGRGRIRC